MINTLLNNAITSIQIGVKDYLESEKDLRRVISAIRNIYAGVLLLFKEKLLQISPENSNELFLKKEFKIKSINGKLKVIGKGTNTVDYKEIRERLTVLNIYVDWDRVDKVRRIRNEIEHYRTNKSIEDVREVIWNLFPVIRDFIKEHLEYEPVELLGKDTWEVLLEVEEVYSKEKEICKEEVEKFVKDDTLKKIILDESKCIYCYSSLIHPKDRLYGFYNSQFFCKVCGKEFYFDSLNIEEMLREYYALDIYNSHKYGETFFYRCYECGTKAVLDDEKSGELKCLACGEVLNSVCDRCQQAFGTEEDVLTCPDCWAEILDRE